MKFGLCYVETVDILILSILVKRHLDVSKFSQKGVLCFSDLGIFTGTVVLQ